MHGSRPTKNVPRHVQTMLTEDDYEYLHSLGEPTLAEALRQAITRARALDRAIADGLVPVEDGYGPEGVELEPGLDGTP